MKKAIKTLSLFLVLSMLLSVGAFASGGPSDAASATAEAPAAAGPAAPATGSTIEVGSLPPSEYATLTNYTARNDSGNIYIGHDVVGSQLIELDDTVTGPAYTAVLASGEMAQPTITGTLVLVDDTAGESASDFSGQGAAFVAYGGAQMTIEDAEVYTDGFERTGIIVSQQAGVTVKDSSFTVLGANPLTEAYDGYVNSANQNIMLSPPWVLGIMGGARVVNMIGATPTLTVINSEMTAGGWALISTDSGSDMVINVVDTDMSFLPEGEGGMDSGWRIFGYDEDAYGSGYGSYYIGNPSQYYYGATFNGVTYAAIITGATTGHYASSNGSIDLYDANGEYLETVEGAGRPTVINGVFGFMMHNSLTDGLYVVDGTIVNTEDAIVIYKAADGDFYFDEAELNSKNGVLFQMIDNDDDSRVGMVSMAEGFSKTYEDERLNTVSGEPAENTGIGFPGVNFDYASKTGGNTVTATYTNGDYTGNIYNGTGYYNQTGDNLTVTIGEGATLTGDIAMTSTVKAIPYSASAIEGIAYYGDDISYVLLDADGNAVTDEAAAAYIQFTVYTMDQYFLQGHVQNKVHYNGASTIEVIVEDGAVWTVTGESLITKLTVAEGGTVYGALTENSDGSVTIVPANEPIPAGEYGGTVTAVGGGQNVGGGVTDDGVLDVEAAANALITGGDAGASGEPSGEPAAEAAELASIEVTIRINGEEYKTVQVGASVEGNVYTFQIAELLDALGVTLVYDETADAALLTADVESVLAGLLGKVTVDEPGEEEPADEVPVEEAPAAEEAVPATDGTENQNNVLEDAGVAPATAEEFQAYVAYLTEYMTAYDGVGDGSFDDSARSMALGELSSYGFGADVYSFPFEMFVTQFGALDYASFVGA